jgi:hypothetical protein
MTPNPVGPRRARFCQETKLGGRMKPVVARDDINRFRDQLGSETDPAKRSILQKLWSKEEDKLAARIDRQRALVETLERCGRELRQLTVCSALLRRA